MLCFCFFILLRGFSQQEYWSNFPFPPSLWSICFGWPCRACLIASFSYASPFTKTRLQSMKGVWTIRKTECWRCLQIVVLEKTFKSLLDGKELKSVNSKLNHPWIYIERKDSEVETPIFWPPDVKSRLIEKDPDTRKDWRQKEKGVVENRMVR